MRKSPDRYVAEPALSRLAARAREEIQRHLDQTSGAVGIPRGTLLARLLPASDPRWAEAIEREMVRRGAYLVVEGEARLPGREDLAGGEQELSRRIAEVFRRGGLNPPSIFALASAAFDCTSWGTLSPQFPRSTGRRWTCFSAFHEPSRVFWVCSM